MGGVFFVRITTHWFSFLQSCEEAKFMSPASIAAYDNANQNIVEKKY